MPTNFRFWRIKFQESTIGPASDIYLGGMALRSVAGGPNLPLANPSTRFLPETQYPVANLLDANAATYYRTAVNGWVTVELASEVDLVEIAITAGTLWNAFAPKRIQLMGGWTSDAFLKVADVSFTGSWAAGETKTAAIPAYSYPKDIEWIERAHINTSFDAVGDNEVTVSKGMGYGVADQDHFAMSKSITYGLIDNLTNGVAKAVAYAVMEEAPIPGQVDGFRMRNAVGRNVIMRGGKGPLPPRETPLEPQ